VLAERGKAGREDRAGDGADDPAGEEGERRADALGDRAGRQVAQGQRADENIV